MGDLGGTNEIDSTIINISIICTKLLYVNS